MEPFPLTYESGNPRKSLKSYVEDYLTQEIKDEGLVRNLPAFSRFLDSVGFSNGQMINYTNIALDCGIDGKTVKEYYQILFDTFLGYFLFPFRKQTKRKLITATPKFYLFDVGVANILSKRSIEELKGDYAGQMLPQYILTEIIAYKGLNDLDFDLSYWRTKTGLEVDFIISGSSGASMIAIEVKISKDVKKNEIKGLLAFAEEHPGCKNIVVCGTPRARVKTYGEVQVLMLPIESFLKQLWDKEIIL